MSSCMVNNSDNLIVILSRVTVVHIAMLNFNSLKYLYVLTKALILSLIPSIDFNVIFDILCAYFIQATHTYDAIIILFSFTATRHSM